MAGIVVKGFAGMRPIMNPKHIQTNEATEAKDVRLFSSAIEPIRDLETVTPLKITGSSATTIFRAQDTSDEANNWFEFSGDVDVALSPITQDQFKRIYWSGDGVPKMAPTSVAFSSGSSEYPRGEYVLGIPKPTSAPIASGTSVVDITKSVRRYGYTLFDNSSSGTNFNRSDTTPESGLSEIFEVNSMSEAVDSGTLHPESFTAISSSLFEINFSVEHNLEPEDFVVFSDSTETGWNTQWEVDSVNSAKTIRIKNTSTFPSNNPAGDFVLKKRFVPKVTLNFSNENLPSEPHLGLTLQPSATDLKKRIYREHNGVFHRIAEISNGQSTFQDIVPDASVSATYTNTLSTALQDTPPAPDSAPLLSIPFDDETIQSERNLFIKSATVTGSLSLKNVEAESEGSHNLEVGQFISGFLINGGGSATVSSVDSSTRFKFIANTSQSQVKTAPFSITVSATSTVPSIYAYSFKTANGESALSPHSALIKVKDGETKVVVNLGTTVPTERLNITKKIIYRSLPAVVYNSYTTGTFYKIAEVPVSQLTYEDSGLTANSITSNAKPQIKPDVPEKNFVAIASLPPTVVAESRNYVYTYVSAYGEEGQPSEPSTRITINPFEPVDVTTLTAPSGNYNITKKYIYRTSSGTGDANFQFVGEIPVATTGFVDNKKQSELGELITASSNEPPPSDMKGLKVMANGIMVGFSGKDVCFSEPFLPHAWSSANFIPVDHNIVGLGTFGQSVVILTESYPYIATGIDPNAMSLQKTSLQQACISKRSIVETGSSVIYASPDGLVSIGINGVDVISKSVLSQEQWQSYNPSSIHGYYHEGRYYGFYKTDSTSGQIIFNLTGSDAPLILGTQYSSAGMIVPVDDSIFITDSGSIKKLDKASTFKTYFWKSKLFEFPQETNFSVAQVNADSYGSGITFKLYADGALKETVSVTSDEPFRLSAGYLAKDWQFTLEGTGDVTSVLIAQSLTELGEV